MHRRFFLALALSAGAGSLLTGCGSGWNLGFGPVRGGSEGNGVPNRGDVSVRIVATGLSDGKLALNNGASFTATVTGFDGDPSGLRYHWILANGRGELSDGTNVLPNPFVGGNSIRCGGKTAGEEQITIKVLDATNTVLATAFIDFTIVAPTGSGGSRRGCFDQPKIYFQSGTQYQVINFDGSGRQSIGVSGGTGIAISPDGEWIAVTDDSLTTTGWDMYVQRCDGTERRIIPDGTGEDSIAKFSPDSKTLYFMRPEPSTPRVQGKFRPSDIAAYDLASGRLRFVTKIGPSDEYVGDFTVSPVTGEIAFFRENLSTGSTKLSLVQPESGLIRDFTTLSQGGGYTRGLDWSPDGGDIIFAVRAGEQGIYRIKLTDGSQPLLLFRTLANHAHYYAGGSRIVWGGQENGQNDINLWSIDANGNDMRQLTDIGGTEFMQGVLH